MSKTYRRYSPYYNKEGIKKKHRDHNSIWSNKLLKKISNKINRRNSKNVDEYSVFDPFKKQKNYWK